MKFKHLIWNLNSTEIDLANVIINIIERNVKFDVGHRFDYDIPFYSLETNLHELASSLGYLTLDDKAISELTNTMDNLSKIQASLYFQDDTERVLENTHFIQKYILSSMHRDLNKRIKILLCTSLVKVLRENKKLFKKLYTYDRYELRGKYSTILYDELSRKSPSSMMTATNYTIDQFIDLVDFELEPSSNIESWTKINGNILSRAAKEIEAKSNMYFHYEKIKEKLNDKSRIQTNGVRFETSIAPEIEPTSEYFDDDFLMERKVAYYIEKTVELKLKDLRKFGTVKPEDEDNYRYAERKKLFAKDHDEYAAKVKLQEWINWVKYTNQNEHGLVTIFNYNDNEYVTINSNHRLMDVISNKILSSNAKDTFIKLQKFLNDDGDYGIADVDYKKEFSISYTKG